MAARTDWERHAGHEALLPVYVITSGEALLLHEAVDTLRRRVLSIAADFNRDEFAAPFSSAKIVAAANTLPVMAPMRWVHVRDVHKIPAAEHPALIAYAQAPLLTTVLCFSGEKLDGRTKFGQALGKAVFALELPRPNELVGWINKRAQRAGINVQHDAVLLLAELIGNDLGTLSTTLDRLTLYAGPAVTITSEHVEANVCATRVSSIFELTDALGARDWLRTTMLLRNIIEGGESALVVLAMLVRQLRLMLQVKALQASRARPADMAQTLGIRPFLVEPLNQAARRYSLPELYTALQAAGDADMQLKSSRLSHTVVLEKLLLRIVGGPQAQPC